MFLKPRWQHLELFNFSNKEILNKPYIFIVKKSKSIQNFVRTVYFRGIFHIHVEVKRLVWVGISKTVWQKQSVTCKKHLCSR